MTTALEIQAAAAADVASDVWGNVAHLVADGQAQLDRNLYFHNTLTNTTAAATAPRVLVSHQEGVVTITLAGGSTYLTQVDIDRVASFCTGTITIPNLAGIQAILQAEVDNRFHRGVIINQTYTPNGDISSTGGTGGFFTLLTNDSSTVTISSTFSGTLQQPFNEATLKQQKKDWLKEYIKGNLLPPNINRTRKALTPNVPPNEMRARNSLRDLITEEEWRRYVANGFIMVRGASGKWYQVFNGFGVNVYQDNKKLGYICIHTEGGTPPTDHVLTMKTLIEIDEEILYKKGNWRGAGFVFTSNQVAMARKSLVDYADSIRFGKHQAALAC